MKQLYDIIEDKSCVYLEKVELIFILLVEPVSRFSLTSTLVLTHVVYYDVQKLWLCCMSNEYVRLRWPMTINQYCLSTKPVSRLFWLVFSHWNEQVQVIQCQHTNPPCSKASFDDETPWHNSLKWPLNLPTRIYLLYCTWDFYWNLIKNLLQCILHTFKCHTFHISTHFRFIFTYF